MKVSDVQVGKSKSECIARPGDGRIGILAAVNSTEGAYNSLEYALGLAKVTQATIHLLYLSDVGDIPESNNPLVIQRTLARLNRKATACVESLKEMIEESGVSVPTTSCLIGKSDVIIQQKVKSLTPGMIILGRDSFSRHIIESLIRSSTCPVLFVPGRASPRVPTSIVLSSRNANIPEIASSYLLPIIQRTTREITILHGVKEHRERNTNPFPNAPSNTVRVTHSHYKDSSPLDGIRDFVRNNMVDLLCLMEPQRPFLKRLFFRSLTATLVFRLSIPIMVIPENAKAMHQPGRDTPGDRL